MPSAFIGTVRDYPFGTKSAYVIKNSLICKYNQEMSQIKNLLSKWAVHWSVEGQKTDEQNIVCGANEKWPVLVQNFFSRSPQD